MQLTEHRNEQQFFIRHAGADSIMVIDRTLVHSFALSAERIIEELPVREVGDLSHDIVSQVLSLQPEVVLLGTGAKAIFPAQSTLAEFLRRQIGLETMDNAAAARTFNVLIGEGRRAVAVFVLPG